MQVLKTTIVLKCFIIVKSKRKGKTKPSNFCSSLEHKVSFLCTEANPDFFFLLLLLFFLLCVWMYQKNELGFIKFCDFTNPNVKENSKISRFSGIF